eukprot:gene13407-9600_t
MVLSIVGPQSANNLRPVFEKLASMVGTRGFKLVKNVTDPAKALPSLVGLVPFHFTAVGAAAHDADSRYQGTIACD